MRYSVGERTGAASAAFPAVAVLWNPHASKALRVVFVSVEVVSALMTPLLLARTTTRGTPGSTVTPDADNAYDRESAPASGAVLDMALYTGTAPTVATPDVERWPFASTAGTSVWRTFERRSAIWVPAGTGLGVISASGAIGSARDVTFEWDE